MKAIAYSDIDNIKWKQFVQESDEAWFWHDPDFIEAWPYGEPIPFAIVNELEEIVLIQSLHYGNLPNYMESIGGLARRNGLTKAEEKRLSQAYIKIMDEIIDTYKITKYTYCMEATLPRAYWPDRCPLVNPLVMFGYNTKAIQAYIIDLEQDINVIFGNFSQTTRNLIHRFGKDMNYRIVEATSSKEDFEKYYRLHVETYERTGVKPHPQSYFEKIFYNILPTGKCRVVFFYRSDELIAANNMVMYKDVAMYWTGASRTEKGDGESRLLMYDQIKYAKEKGCRYFECGEAFPYERNGKLKGLNQFKHGFGGVLHPVFKGAYVMKPLD